MSNDEGAHLAKARRMLAQADGLSVEDAPESVVHLAYYAMFHAATAVLLRHRSSVAVTHNGLIGAFGRLDVGLGEHARTHGRALNRAKDLRLRADYGVAYTELAEATISFRDDARAFVVPCAPAVAERCATRSQMSATASACVGRWSLGPARCRRKVWALLACATGIRPSRRGS